MIIHQNFIGGNGIVKEMHDATVVIENELRDTTEDWFYWAFCVEGAENQTLTFQFQPNRLGYFGPAISHDLEHWQWLGRANGNSFTYTFGETESRVYFAHSLLYHPQRFLQFAETHGLSVEALCTGYKGSPVPCVAFGNGNTGILLTARHHACESTGSYVLEGVLEELLARPMPDSTVFCVPFVDYEGVIRGDQGKSRAPHDHNRDYSYEAPSIYPECEAIKRYALENGYHFAFDFHSPWHMSNENDTVFIVQNSTERICRFRRFGELLETAITPQSLSYRHANDYPPETGWNKGGTQLANYMKKRKENQLSFTLETAYFGTVNNPVSDEKLVELGRCFARALKQYRETECTL